MSEVAINALAVDLTRLLSSAKGRQSTQEDLAQTTSLFRQCKQNSGVKENSGVEENSGDEDNSGAKESSGAVARDTGGETSTAPGTPPVGGTLRRKTPLPDEVDSCCYAYAPHGDQKPTTTAAEDEEVKARSPARRTRPASPSHGDVDRRAYTYADGFKPRRRDQQPPAAYFSYSQHGASRKWHDRRNNRRASGPHFPGRQHQHHQHHQQQQQQQQDQQQHHQQQQQDQQPRQDPDAKVNPEPPSRGAEGGTVTGPAVGRGDAQPRGAALVGEAWSENAVGGGEGSLGRERDRASVGDIGSQRPSVESRRNSSELHEFLYREGRSREDRRRAKQAERDRELTFRPRLATTKYWAAASARRRRRGRADDFGLATGRGSDGAAAAAEDANATGGGAPARFEMLYEDSKAQLLRAQEDRVKIPAACTFQPQLISHRPTSGGRGRHVARGSTAAATAAANPKDADVGREAYALDGSAELFDGSVNDPSVRNERGDSDKLDHDNGNDDDDDNSQAWVNSLVFGDNREHDGHDEDDGHVDNSRSSGTNGRGDNNDNANRTEWGRGQEQHGDCPRRFDHHDSRRRTPSAGLRGENGGGYGEISSGSNGGLSAEDGPSEEGSGKGSRRVGGYSRRENHRRSRSLPSRSRGVTRSGVSEGGGGRTEAVGTSSYAERLYRGHDEQQQVWARRQVSRQERARLELKGCTFQPRLDQNSQHRGRAGRTYLVPCPPPPAEGQNGGARRRSSSAVRWKRTTPQEEEEEASGGRGGMAAAATHERLYHAAELVRARRREEVAERRKAETVGCTFQPEVNHAPAAPCATAVQRRGSTYPGGNAKCKGGDHRGVRTGSMNSNNDFRNNGRDNGSVFDRLVAAGEKAKQRKAMLGQMTPPGCTFRPQVNVHGNGKRPPGHTSSSAGSTQNGGGTFAAPSQPHAQHPPPYSYGGAPRTAENASSLPPPPPPRTGSSDSHAKLDNDGHAKGGNQPTAGAPRRRSRRGSGGSSVVGSSDTAGRHAADNSFLRELAAGANTAAAAADAVLVAEVDEEGTRIPYRESRFSPRRGRRKQGGGCDGGDGHGDRGGGGGGESGRESPVCERLFELGHRQQRRRNDSPRDTPQSQRERDELEELKLCTFSPVLFTKAYRRPRPRLATGAPSNRMEANG
ncbi:unnamed protein product, partial [Ectocarpus fasciculatus]